MTRPLTLLAAVSLLAVSAPAAVRGAAPELRALFPRQAEITAPAGRLARLTLPPEVIAACRGDLSDLRIFDPRGREVPYFVDSGLPPATVREVRRTLTPELLSVAQEEVVREGAPNLLRERYELVAPAPPAAGGRWDLVVESRHPAFVRRVEVAAGGEAIAAGSLFRLRQPLRERTRLALPAAAAGPLAVTVEGDEDFYLEPVLRFETARRLAATERAEVDLEEVSRTVGEGRTRIELRRPRGLVPDVLRLATSTAAFHRRVEVWDEGPEAVDEVLGGGTVFRVPAPVPVEDLELPVGRLRGDRLRLVIVDGDSPPLDGLRVRAVVRQPALIFSLPADGGEGAATLGFGGARAWAPRYDLGALRPLGGRGGELLPAGTRLEGGNAEVGERLYDRSLLAPARLGAAVANPRFDPAPVLAFAHRPGSALDSRRYRYRRELAATPSPEGLIRLALGLEDLAAARGDLADLRVVDGEDRQWAYLVERRSAEEVLPLAVTGPEVEDGVARYRPRLPAAGATLSRLVLETDVPFFDRDYRLIGWRGGEEVVLARGRLARRIGDPRPLAIACAAQWVERLELRVTDGDDAPLSLESVRGHFPVPELYFAAPAGSYALLLGDPDAVAPRYELERVRGLVLAVASVEAEAEELVENPAYSAGARLLSDGVRQQVVLWLALAAAVVGLTALTLRLARRGTRPA